MTGKLSISSNGVSSFKQLVLTFTVLLTSQMIQIKAMLVLPICQIKYIENLLKKDLSLL